MNNGENAETTDVSVQEIELCHVYYVLRFANLRVLITDINYIMVKLAIYVPV